MDKNEIRKEFLNKFSSSSKAREDIFKRDNYKCNYCGLEVITITKLFDLIDKRQYEELEKLNNNLITQEDYELFNARSEIESSEFYKSKMASIDHIVPIESGGTNDKSSLKTCCKECNSRKHTSIQLENGYTRIANDLLEKFSKVKMSGTCWQVLMAILRKLYGFGKKEDWIEYSQIMKITELPKSRISFSIKQLCKYGIVTQKRNGIKQILSINKNFSRVIRTHNSSTIINNSCAKVERSVTQTRTTKDNIKKMTKENSKGTPLHDSIVLLIEEFSKLNPACNRMYGNKTQRLACEDLITTYGEDRITRIIRDTLPKTNKIKFFPTITTPLQLRDKFITLESAIIRYKQEQPKNKVAF